MPRCDAATAPQSGVWHATVWVLEQLSKGPVKRFQRPTQQITQALRKLKLQGKIRRSPGVGWELVK